MALRILTYSNGDVTILVLEGRLVGGEESEEFLSKLTKLLEEGRKQFVLDFGRATFVDSAGVGGLVRVYAIARSRGATLKLSGIGPQLEDVLSLANLTDVFDQFAELPAAVESFGTHFGWSYCSTHGRYPGTGDCPKCP
jgi:anti-sigma B factor antagonist